MDNQEIAKILYEISEYLEMEDVAFKPRAYEKAAHSIETLEENVADIYKTEGLKGLDKIPAVGKNIAEKIEELIKTGHLKYYEKLKKKMPVEIDELTAVEGIGPKMIMKLYEHLGIKNLKSLEKAAEAGKIRDLEDFGEKTEKNILQGIEFLKKNKGRFILGFVLPQIREIEERIKKIPGVKKAIVAGSIRRMKETIGDCDILVATSSLETAKKVKKYLSSIKLKNGIDFNLRIVPEKSFGSALQYFTGNKDHNIALRKIAIKKGYKLNEYGIYKNEKQIAGKTEEEVYKTLGLKWIEPELRQNTGELETKNLPKLIKYNELKGNLQMHTTWSDGINSIEQMAEETRKMGLEYIAITDHARGTLGNKMGRKKLAEQGKEIDKLNKSFGRFRILKGVEIDILNDGKLFMKDKFLKKLDLVGAGIHSNFKMSKQKMTERIIRAIKNPHVDILFHPTGRLISQRPPYEIDIKRIIRAAKQTKTILEINSFYNRLDLKDKYIRMAVEAGVKLSINTDAHSITHLHYLELGIAQARRGWATKNDIINTLPVEQFLKLLKK